MLEMQNSPEKGKIVSQQSVQICLKDMGFNVLLNHDDVKKDVSCLEIIQAQHLKSEVSRLFQGRDWKQSPLPRLFDIETISFELIERYDGSAYVRQVKNP